ncbi:cadmium-translocating P-type ATPase [Candidatus Bathyarchaeota archaeon]|nr:cadmium-translocating P-type ATPase [Candidatus Bathyarchaeota archaeon]MBS7613821.1 cadmium-translocating P-type ATPase [Candidatus Bathyarchaeota archaeon]MBS7618515.1 cadmium-translocating P-type ATPase [Candidatus Bathyarchaeota archaeon]
MVERVKFSIKGMHCENCAKTIEKALIKERGVVSAHVSFPLEEAIIEYDSMHVSIEEIKRIIKEAGYEALEEKEKSDDIRSGWWRFWLGVALTIPTWIIANFFYESKWNLLLFSLSTPVQIVLGLPFYRGAYFSLKQKTADLNVLVSLSTLTAYFYSVATTLFISGPVFYDASTTVLTTITLGMLLEKISQGKVGEAIKKLMKLKAKTAKVLRNGEEVEVSPEHIQKGDIVVVRPGEMISTDGVIIEGEATIDESMITGESMPVDKKEGDYVFGGTINRYGFFKFKATKVGEETVLAQIIRLVEEAQTSKAQIQRVADRVLSLFIPSVVTIAILTFTVWYFLLRSSFLFALTAFVSVLVIACPCALGIATPTAIMVGIGKGAEMGILVKGGQYLEKARELDTIVFDKTGTLTKGEPEVTDVIGNVLQLAASLAKNTTHPLDIAIVKEAEKRGIKLLDVQDFKIIPGGGIMGRIGGRSVLLGSRRVVKSDLGIELEEDGKTVMLISVDGEIKGAIAVADTLRKYSKDVVNVLKKKGMDVYMITGDSRRTAGAIARKLGIENVLAEVLPQDKEKTIRALQKSGRVVGAVGDGINDAPMLATADIGIAMGAGTDIAKETGGIVLVKDDLRDVVRAIELSRATFSKIRQNLFLAFIYNVLAIPVASGLFYQWLGFLLKPEICALAMIISDVSVIGNSLLLKRWKCNI